MEAEPPAGEHPFAVVDLDARRLHHAVLTWGAESRRDLPWRHTRDPWAVLVSELMLQQTQVARVVPRYEAFMQQFPDLATCAAAPRSAVIASWAGLGYNRRAVNLHEAAIVTVARHDGRLPADLGQLLGLPGIGPYTARAVLVFAFEHDVGVVDTNVRRLLARWTGAPLGAAAAQRLADELVPTGRAWAWNQALFDLGATVCGARRADCGTCRARACCAWRGVGPDPAAGARSPQSTFQGSDRQGRGRLVDALRQGAVRWSDLPVVMGWPGDESRARRVAETLVGDGLAVRGGDGLRLPG